MSMPDRGEIWVADLNPPRGTESGKTRPVLIVQAQALLDADHPSTLVAPLTSRLLEDAEPLRIRIPAAGDLRQESDVLIDQLRAIDNRRLVRGPLARMRSRVMASVDEALLVVLGLADRQRFPEGWAVRRP